MAVIQQTIKTELSNLYDQMKEFKDSDEAKEYYVENMSKIIRNAILSASVNAGITVSVDPNSGAGSTTGTGSLS